MVCELLDQQKLIAEHIIDVHKNKHFHQLAFFFFRYSCSIMYQLIYLTVNVQILNLTIGRSGREGGQERSRCANNETDGGCSTPSQVPN